ncbi:MAG: ankyrin repeat domain-containing protein [Archangium sp.]|nr:ankyrin repeat domain-containing protein [Archangium sp.]
MTPENAWKQVFATPTDRAARKVLADALLEAGDAFGEYMSLCLRVSEGNNSKAVAERREALRAVRDARLEPVARFFTQCIDDESGLPCDVTSTIEQVLEGGERLLALGPAVRLGLAADHVTKAQANALTAFDLGRFAAVRVGSAYDHRATEAQRGAVVERLAPALGTVRRLTLNQPTTVRALAALARYRRAPLVELWVPRPDTEPLQRELVELLAREPAFQSLESLSISGGMAKRVVAGLRGLPKLKTLWVGESIALGSASKLIDAAKTGKLPALRKALAEGAPINGTDETGWTALHWACSNARREAALALIKAGADVSGAGDRGPINFALEARFNITQREVDDRVAIVRALMKAGSPLTILGHDGTTVLAKACELGRGKATELVKDLLAAKPDLTAVSRNGRTLLHWSAEYGHLEVVRAALKAGIGLDEQDADGLTALHLAAAEGQRAAAFLLLDQGASRTVTSRRGQTPFDVSRRTDKVLLKRLKP